MEENNLILKEKSKIRFFGQVNYEETGKWNARKDNQLERLDFQKKNILDTIKSRQRLKWVGTLGEV